MKTFIGIPCHLTMSPLFACSLGAIEDKKDLVIEWAIGNPYVSRARNELTMNFLLSDCDRLMWIDSDILFSPEQLDRLLSHDVPIVGGFYYLKQRVRRAVCEPLPMSNFAEQQRLMTGEEQSGLMMVQSIGTGFMSVKREVFERMIEVYGKEIWYNSETTNRKEYDFWTTGIYRPANRWLPEDWMFCQRARDLGYTVWGDTKCVVGHLGTAIYPI